MLGKLLKHELIATWKVPAALDALLLILGIVTAVVIRTIPHLDDSLGMNIFMFSFIGLFYIGIIAANIIVLVYLVIRYYRNLYTSEGYLTFTLPVKTDMIIHSKVITGSLWVFLSYVCTFIALITAGAGFLRTMEVAGEDVGKAVREICSFFGFTDPGFAVLILFMILITPVAGVLCLYFSVSVGQLWQSHKVLGAVLCIIGLYIVNQVLSQIAFFGSGFWQLMAASAVDIDASFGLIYKNMLLILTVMTLIESIIYYAVCLIIARKKVNLD